MSLEKIVIKGEIYMEFYPDEFLDGLLYAQEMEIVSESGNVYKCWIQDGRVQVFWGNSKPPQRT